MRTSAQKNFRLLPRIEKEIPREIDRAPRAENITPIARSHTSALKAIERDRNFCVVARFGQADRTRDRQNKKNFLRARGSSSNHR
jgi:hypothetical protein